VWGGRAAAAAHAGAAPQAPLGRRIGVVLLVLLALVLGMLVYVDTRLNRTAALNDYEAGRRPPRAPTG
jgi:hypothetical protein